MPNHAEQIGNQESTNKSRAGLDNLSQMVNKVVEVGQKLGEKGKEALKGALDSEAKSELGAFFQKGVQLFIALGLWGAKKKNEGGKKSSNAEPSTPPTPANPPHAPITMGSRSNTGADYESGSSDGETASQAEFASQAVSKKARMALGPFESYAQKYKGRDTTIVNGKKLKGSALRENLQFDERFLEVCLRLEVNPDHLRLVMHKESKHDPEAQNKSGATGLIQWMPKTAKGYGITTTKIKRMSGLEQLDWVFKYFKKHIGKLNSPFSLYLATFYPAALSKGENFIFGSEDKKRGGEDGFDRARVVTAANGIGKTHKGPFDPKYPGDETKRFINKAAFRRYVDASKLA